MINLSYHLSEKIIRNIKNSDILHARVLLSPITPSQEIKLRWDANTEKIYWGLTLVGNPLSKRQMARILSESLPKNLTKSQKEVLSYKNALSYIRNNWTASNEYVIPRDILNIYDLSCKNIFGSSTSYFKSKENEILQILKYIESGNDHPIIKAGLIQIEIIKLLPFGDATEKVGRLLSHLILSKYGYDLRGFLVLEDYYRSDLMTLKDVSNSVERYKSATIWLEYFSSGVVYGMNKVLENIQNNKQTNTLPAAYWKLNERLQTIINLLENPNTKITNKEVQKKFEVSQITASRDLTKLSSMGILLAHGKGRSVFYTKV